MVTEQNIKEQIQNDGGVTVFVYWDEQEQCYNATTANSDYMDKNVYEAVEGALEDEIRQRVVKAEQEQLKDK